MSAGAALPHPGKHRTLCQPPIATIPPPAAAGTNTSAVAWIGTRRPSKIVAIMHAHLGDYAPEMETHYLELIAKLDPPAAG